MKRKILTTLIVALFATLTLSAVSPSNFKIYINAGHGSWGPNDRPNATIPYPNLASTGRPDTCGFYESNTNLWKAFGLYDELHYGAGVPTSNMRMSRWKNGPYPYVKGASNQYKYNKLLSTICTEVNSFKPNAFISIHSNAASDGAKSNYSIILYRGSNTTEKISGSRAMGRTVWNWAALAHNKIDVTTNYPNDYTSSTSGYVVGDNTFYGTSGTNGYLGVLKHSYPGFLTEGYFHTYQPARHRALNIDYCRQEGVRYARGFMDYFSLGQTGKGVIMGAVKNNSKSLENSLYKYYTGTDKAGNNAYDNKYPINGATVRLYNSAGTLVKTYKTDNNYNGVFVFEKLTPGTYTVQAIASGFSDLSKTVTVSANQTTYPIFLMSSGQGTVIDDDPTPEPEPEPEPEVTTTVGAMQFTNDGGRAYTMTGNVISSAQYGENTVILTDTPCLYVINAREKTIRQLSTSGITAANNNGIQHPLRSIAFTSDGYLVGCNKVVCASDDEYVSGNYGTTRGTLQFYYWAPSLSANAAPSLYVSTQRSAGYYEAVLGDAFAINGSLANNKITVFGRTVRGDLDGYRYEVLTVRSGAVDTSKEASVRGTALSYVSKLGSKVSIAVSPRDNSNVILDGELAHPTEVYMANSADMNDASLVGSFSGSSLPAGSTRAAYFTFDGKKMMAAANSTSAGANTGIRLYDITEGLSNATLYSTSNTDLSSANATYSAVHYSVIDGVLTLYLIKDKTIVRFAQNTMSGTSDDPIRGIFAYGLDMQYNADDDSFDFIYGANNNAEESFLVFTDAETGDVVYEKQIFNAVCTVMDNESTYNGLASTTGRVNVTRAELQNAIGRTVTLNWGIRLKGKSIPDSGLLLNYTGGTKYTNDNGAVAGNNHNTAKFANIYITVDNSPESDYFGYVYVNNYSGYDTSTSAQRAQGFDPVMSNGIVRYVPHTAETVDNNGTTQKWNNWQRTRFVPDEHGDTRTTKFTFRGSGIGQTNSQGVAYSQNANVFRENIGITTDYLGNIYMAEHTSGSWSTKAGITILDPHDMTNDHDAVSTYFYQGGPTFDSSVTRYNGTPASADWGSGLWTRTDVSGGHYGSSVSGVAVTGTGANSRLCAVIQDFDRNNGTTFSGDIAIYDIGNSDGSLKSYWGYDTSHAQPSKMLATGVSRAFLADTTDVSGLRRLQGDNRGGLWVCTARPDAVSSRDNVDCPILMYFTAEQIAMAERTGTNQMGASNAAFNMARDMTTAQGKAGGCKGGGFAVSPDGKLLALVNGTGYILIYDVAWTDGVPSLQLRKNTDATVQRFLCDNPTDKGEVLQMAFDWGNNLYAGGKCLTIYSIKDDTDNTHYTPARKAQTISLKALTNIQNIADGEVGSEEVVLNDYLVAVKVLRDGKTVIAKSSASYPNETSVMDASQTDPISAHGISSVSAADADQSYWIILNLPRTLSASEIEAFNGARITDIQGVVDVMAGNNEMTLTKMPTVESAYSFTPNTYVSSNFMETAWNSFGDEKPQFYFVEPKAVEYCRIADVEWSADDNCFYGYAVDNTGNWMFGGFEVALDYYEGVVNNAYPTDPAAVYNDGWRYTFNAVVKLAGESLRPNGTTINRIKTLGQNADISSHYVIYPITSADESTSVAQVVNNSKVVSVKLFNAQGVELLEKPTAGVYFKVITYADGTRRVVKNMMK